jgi:hypothetical protein
VGEYDEKERRQDDARRDEELRVTRIRGVVMLLAAAVALWEGWQIRHGEQAMIAYGLGVLALAIGVWHLTHKAPAPRV